jgi:uncharacterized protein (TIGR02246 family)
MLRHPSPVALVLLLTFTSCTGPAKTPDASEASAKSTDPAALRDSIQAREREWSAAYLAANAAGVAALYTDDGASVQPAGDWHRGRDAITKGMQAQFDTVAATAREDITEEVIPLGDYAVEIGHYSYQGTSKTNKAPRSGAGRYMVVWRKDSDGVWRLHRDIGSEAPPKKP